MHIPSRVEVLSWNENQIGDLLREHNLLDCVDCVYQRHIDGQKLLNLKEGDVMYFLEIHDERSREKLWSIVKKITEKRGGVQSLMNKFQGTSEWNDNAVEEDDNMNEFSDDSEDSFDSDYDEPEEEPSEQKQTAISLARKETITQKLMSFKLKPAPPQVDDLDDEDYPSEDIYDVPEDGCGEPDEDMYDVPSEDSGGGVVGRHSALERKESDQYLIPDDRKLMEYSQEDDEQDYEDLNGAPPPMGRPDFDTQEDYVVPDTKTAVIVPPRPPKPSDTKPFPSPLENGHRKPPAEKSNAIRNLQAKLLQPENYEPPQPQRATVKKPAFKSIPVAQELSVQPPPCVKKQKSLPRVHLPVSAPPKPYAAKNQPKAPAQPPRIPKKIEMKPPDTPDEPDQDEYEFPELPSTVKKPAFKSIPVAQELSVQPPPLTKKPNNKKKVPVEPDQETYEPPDQPPRHPPKPPLNRKPPVEIEQENYEAPETPARPGKKPQPAVMQEQENYEPPALPTNKPPVLGDPEENYEAPDQLTGQADADEQEDYEIPDTKDVPSREVPHEQSKKSHFKNLFNRVPSKKSIPNVPSKMDKKKTTTSSPLVPENSPLPARQPPNPDGKSIFGKFRGEKAIDKRSSMALPSLPTDKVDSKTKNSSSELPSLPPKPLPEKPSHKERPLPIQRKPDPPPSKPPQKTKAQLLEHQPWFHGTISKPVVSEILKSTKKHLGVELMTSTQKPKILRYGGSDKHTYRLDGGVCSKFPDGAYLVRNSSRYPGNFTMSILYKTEIRHLNMPCDSNGWYRLGDSGHERFKNIEELVTYFIKHDVEFSAGGKTPLTHACLK